VIEIDEKDLKRKYMAMQQIYHQIKIQAQTQSSNNINILQQLFTLSSTQFFTKTANSGSVISQYS
jgi:hypothetical protein